MISINHFNKKTYEIPDKEIDCFLSKINSSQALKFVRDKNTDKKFIETYRNWLFSNKNYMMNSLDEKKFNSYIISGITQSFHDFYQIHHNKILKVRRGEYPYHKVFFKSIGRKWGWIEDEGLHSNDFVIISYPFSGNGSIGHETKEILNLCNRYQVPVLLDCCFWGLSSPLSIDLTEYPCIEIVSFSLSKFFNIGRLRIGMMYSKYKEQASGAILGPYNYVNSWSAYIAFELMNHFPINYMYNKYRKAQKAVCKELHIEPSETLFFGLSKEEKWKDFSRDGVFNRIYLSEAISQFVLSQSMDK